MMDLHSGDVHTVPVIRYCRRVPLPRDGAVTRSAVEHGRFGSPSPNEGDGDGDARKHQSSFESISPGRNSSWKRHCSSCRWYYKAGS